MNSRRQFLRQPSQIAAGTLLPGDLSATSSQRRTSSAADTLSVALIGCNSMGWADLSSMIKHPGVRCVALCDMDQTVLTKRAADLEKLTASSAAIPKASTTIFGNFPITKI